MKTRGATMVIVILVAAGALLPPAMAQYGRRPPAAPYGSQGGTGYAAPPAYPPPGSYPPPAGYPPPPGYPPPGAYPPPGSYPPPAGYPPPPGYPPPGAYPPPGTPPGAPPPQPYAYPPKGQSPEQVSTDQSQCAAWATQQTGFNPSAPPPATAAPATTASSGEPKGLVGGVNRRWERREKRWGVQEPSQQAPAAAPNPQQTDAYNRALDSCLSARGYTVR
jgi:hypothetical protein